MPGQSPIDVMPMPMDPAVQTEISQDVKVDDPIDGAFHDHSWSHMRPVLAKDISDNDLEILAHVAYLVCNVLY